MSYFTLTIGIPTYNGGKYLSDAIDSVLCQLPDIHGVRIEILISDNASTDRTSDIVKKYIIDYPGTITYIINKINVGYDRNVDNLFKVALGEYVWLLGDDDMLAPGSIIKFLKILKEYKDVAIFVFPFSTLDINTGKRNWVPKYGSDVFCESGDEFLQKSLWQSAALSSLCIQTNYWNKENLDEFMGSQWVHVGGMIKIMRHERTGYIVSDEMVVVRVSNSRWSEHNGNQLKIGLKHLLVLESMRAFGYDLRTFNCFLKSRYKNNISDILILKPVGVTRKIEIVKLMFHFFKWSIGFWLFHVPLLLAPNSITDYFINFVRAIKVRLFSASSIKNNA